VTFRSPHPDVAIPEVPLTEFLFERASEYGDKPALVDGPSGRTITYAQLQAMVGALAGGLSARGFGKGDVFAIFMPNLPEYAVAFHGVVAAGGTNTTINPLYTAEELAFQLDDAGAMYLLTIPQFLDRALEAARQTAVKEVFVLGGGDRNSALGGADGQGATPFASLLESGAGTPRPDIDVHEDLVVLPYSSGTTGMPKGVMLTHHNLVANVCQAEAVIRVDEDDTLIGILPFFHIYGMTVIMNSALHCGATVVTLPRFELDVFLGTLQEHRITRAYLVPPIVLALAKHPLVDNYDLSSLKFILSGAAPLGADLAAECSDRLECLVVQGYGLTETSPVTHATPDDPARNKPGSIGPPLPNTECKVVDPVGGTDLGPNEQGEVWIRGPQVMRGYLNKPDATAATIDSDGWLHSGDIGYADEDSYFFIVDRLKELIKYKGYQVAPAELEAILLTHPAVSDAAVIPSPDEETGEVPKAFVVLGREASPDEIMEFVAGKVAPQKKIRLLEVVDEIPKSPSGKILRRVLVERERAG
jgi:acyl-CoA synthetase (AMP-forming)/AMP-acid ligase II